MEVTHNHNAKSQLAKLLAAENITVQHSASAKTAWFDTQKRILMLPLWREMTNDLYDMLVVHEVGHALDTPRDGWIQSIKDIARRIHGSNVSTRAMAAVKGYLNVIEDVRIDKRQKRRFPGARRNYIKGYKELIDRDFFGTLSKDVNAMLFIDRLNIYCKGGSMLGIKFTPAEREWVRKVEAAETFEEVMELTEKIYAWSKHELEQEAAQTIALGLANDDEDDEEGEYMPAPGPDDDEEEESDSSEFDEDDEEMSGGSESDEGDEESSDGDSDDEDEDEKSESDSKEGHGNNDIGDEDKEEGMIPESQTEKAWNEKSSTLILNSNIEYVYAKLPRLLNYDRVVHDYKRVLMENRESYHNRFGREWLSALQTELNRFKASENATISFMVNEFEMRKAADEYLRTSVAKTGVIDTNKLHSYKYNDDLFRRITTVTSGKSHGFVMFVDWSGSMDNNLMKTIKQTFSLAMFCKRVQIPFEVYIFRTRNGYDDLPVGADRKDTNRYSVNNIYTNEPGTIKLAPFTARNVLSSRMNASEFNEGMLYLFAAGKRAYGADTLGSTPLDPCVAISSEIVNRFKAKSKVQIVNTVFLTDGDSDQISGEIEGVERWNRDGNKQRVVIIQDEVTKKSYEGKKFSGSLSNAFQFGKTTGMFLRILKDRTESNVIGFFISPDFGKVYYRYNGYDKTNKTYVKARKSWSENGFFGVTTAGYDEYYIINAKRFNVSEGELKVSKDASKRKMATEFRKFSEKKTNSRVLLSQVVKRIAA